MCYECVTFSLGVPFCSPDFIGESVHALTLLEGDNDVGGSIADFHLTLHLHHVELLGKLL